MNNDLKVIAIMLANRHAMKSAVAEIMAALYHSYILKKEDFQEFAEIAFSLHGCDTPKQHIDEICGIAEKKLKF